MARLLLILLLQCAWWNAIRSQSITVDDLLTLSALSPKSFDNFMSKKGFVPGSKAMENEAMSISFYEKRKKGKTEHKDTVMRSVDLYKKEDMYCFVLNTSCPKEYTDGCNRLKKAGFIANKNTDSTATAPQTFQKRNVTVNAGPVNGDDGTIYSFVLQKKELPALSGVQYAEDLLKFNSHEYLVSFFGEKNVKKDQYYFTEKELKKCSVLFPNTSQQAVFIWEDEDNYKGLSYVLISGLLPTMSAVQYTGHISQNKWVSSNGLYSGMTLRELVELHGSDIEFYGRGSEFAFMISPDNKGNIDFKKAGIMLGCIDCTGYGILEKEKISAIDALDSGIMLYCFSQNLRFTKDSIAAAMQLFPYKTQRAHTYIPGSGRHGYCSPLLRKARICSA
jgi:hypothetical protein